MSEARLRTTHDMVGIDAIKWSGSGLNPMMSGHVSSRVIHFKSSQKSRILKKRKKRNQMSVSYRILHANKHVYYFPPIRSTKCGI